MKERATSQRRWRIGELADATGLTVRTLHHYEHLGLLAPARRKKGNAPKDDEARWRELGDELRACMKAGEAPSAPRPRAVARAAWARIVEFAGGDRATLEALAHLRRLAPRRTSPGGAPR